MELETLSQLIIRFIEKVFLALRGSNRSNASKEGLFLLEAAEWVRHMGGVEEIRGAEVARGVEGKTEPEI